MAVVASSHLSASGISREIKGLPSVGGTIRRAWVKSSLPWEHVTRVSPTVNSMGACYPLGKSLAFWKHLRHLHLYPLGSIPV